MQFRDALERCAPLIAVAIVLSLPTTSLARQVAVSPTGGEGAVTLVEACTSLAPGDTLILAPGVHRGSMPWTNEQGRTEVATGALDVGPVTILGTPWLTIIDADGGTGLRFAPDVDATLRGFILRNFRDGILFSGDDLRVEDCRFESSVWFATGLGMGGVATGRVEVVGCLFDVDGRSSTAIYANTINDPTHSVVIEDVTFQNGGGIELYRGGIVRNCRFTNVGGAIGVGPGADTLVEDCSITNCGTGIWARGEFDRTFVRGTTFRGVGRGIFGKGELTGDRNWIVVGSTGVGIEFEHVAPIVFRNSTILTLGGTTVRLSPSTVPTPFPADFTRNYWGTMDPDAIHASIIDGNDPTSGTVGLVSIFPISNGRVDAVGDTFGGLKARYRERQP